MERKPTAGSSTMMAVKRTCGVLVRGDRPRTARTDLATEKQSNLRDRDLDQSSQHLLRQDSSSDLVSWRESENFEESHSNCLSLIIEYVTNIVMNLTSEDEHPLAYLYHSSSEKNSTFSQGSSLVQSLSLCNKM